MATFHPKKQLWEARRRYTEVDGAQSRRSFWATTEDEAERQANSFIRLRTGIHDGTFNSFAASGYCPTIMHLSRKWKEQVTWALDRHIIPAYGNSPLTAIARADVQVFLNKKTETLSLASVRHIRKVFVAVMNLAEQDDLVRKNVVSQTKLATPEESEKVIYTPEECASLIVNSRGVVWQPAMFLAPFSV